METYKFENGDIITTSGILKDTIITGRKCKTVLPLGKNLIKTTEDALKFSDALWLYGEFDNFRDCVQFWLKATAYRKGLNYVLKITGLSKAAYYRGMSSKDKRKNSDFDKYLAGLLPVKAVFDDVYNRYNHVKKHAKNVIKLRKD